MRILKPVGHFLREDPLTKKVEVKVAGLFKYQDFPADNPQVHLSILVSKGIFTWHFTRAEWSEITKKMRQGPILIGIGKDDAMDQHFYFYSYKDSYFVSEIELSPDDIPLLIHQEQQSKKDKLQKELERIKSKIESEGWSRSPIPEEVQVLVWNRDKGMCVKCGSQELLEFDHIIPLSKGGSNTARNIQLLCQKCNRVKHDIVGG